MRNHAKEKERKRSDSICYWHVSTVSMSRFQTATSEQESDKVQTHEGLDKENG